MGWWASEFWVGWLWILLLRETFSPLTKTTAGSKFWNYFSNWWVTWRTQARFFLLDEFIYKSCRSFIDSAICSYEGRTTSRRNAVVTCKRHPEGCPLENVESIEVLGSTDTRWESIHFSKVWPASLFTVGWHHQRECKCVVGSCIGKQNILRLDCTLSTKQGAQRCNTAARFVQVRFILFFNVAKVLPDRKNNTRKSFGNAAGKLFANRKHVTQCPLRGGYISSPHADKRMQSQVASQ